MSPPPTTPRRPRLDPSDPLAQFSTPASAPVDVRRALRLGLALLLLGLAVGLAIWLVVMIHAAIVRPEPPAVVRRMAATSPADHTMKVPDGEVELPPIATTFAAHLILVLLLSVGARLMLALLRGGAELLRDDPPGGGKDASP